MPSTALDSVARLRRIVVTLQDGDADERWLAERLRQYLDGADLGLTIETALDLAPGSGEERWFQEERRGRRDTILREMAERFWPNHRPGAQAREIERRSLRYVASAWRFDCERDDIPERYCGTESEFLWLAFKAGAMPLKWRQLVTILVATKKDAAA